MKNILIILIVALSTLSCEEVIDLELPASAPRLVINAALERTYEEAGNFYDQATVKLSLSTPFFSTERKPVDDATVTITNLSTNSVSELKNLPFQLGTYQNTTLNSLTIDPEASYKLTVIHNNNTYESIETLNPSTPIDQITQVKRNSSLNDEEFAVEIKYTDIPNMKNFYVFDFGWGNLQSIAHEDFFVDGLQTPTTQFFEETKNTLFVVRFLGSDQRFNNYIDAILQLSGESTNGPFASAPFKAKGNIINTSNPDNFPFGYFHVNEVYTAKLEIVPDASL